MVLTYTDLYLDDRVEFIEQRQDSPAPGRLATDYPYPDVHVTSHATGEFAQRARVALSVGPDDHVIIEERVQFGGYSQWTQEHFHTFTIRSGRAFEVFEKTGSDNAFELMLKWLDEHAPVRVVRVVGDVVLGEAP